MEILGTVGMGFRAKEGLVYIVDDLQRPALLGDAFQRDTLRHIQIVELPNQRESLSFARLEAHEEERLSRQLLILGQKIYKV